MKRKIPSLLLPIVAIGSLGGLFFIIYYFSPSESLHLYSFTISLLPIFLFLIFLFFFAMGTYVFKNKSHGILIGAFVTIYLLFRLNHLTHPFFFVLLFALFLTLELFVSFRK